MKRQVSLRFRIFINLDGNVTYLANNRKNFQVVRHNSETLIFYRRVQATASGIAYYNDSDSTVTDVYTESA